MSSCFNSNSFNTEIGEIIVQMCFNNNQLSTVNALINGVSYATLSEPMEGTFYNGTLQYGGKPYNIEINSGTYYLGSFTYQSDLPIDDPDNLNTSYSFGFINSPAISKGPSKSWWWILVIIIILLIIYLIWRSKTSKILFKKD